MQTFICANKIKWVQKSYVFARFSNKETQTHVYCRFNKIASCVVPLIRKAWRDIQS